LADFVEKLERELECIKIDREMLLDEAADPDFFGEPIEVDRALNSCETKIIKIELVLKAINELA
jgi:hypothetical protein